MTLPAGVYQLTTVEDVEAAWRDLFTYEGDEGEKVIAFANDSRVAIAADAIYVELKKPINAGERIELTQTLRITEPTVAALRLADKFRGEVEKACAVLESICSIPSSEMAKMVATDFKLCCHVIGHFLSE